RAGPAFGLAPPHFPSPLHLPPSEGEIRPFLISGATPLPLIGHSYRRGEVTLPHPRCVPRKGSTCAPPFPCSRPSWVSAYCRPPRRPSATTSPRRGRRTCFTRRLTTRTTTARASAPTTASCRLFPRSRG